MTDLITLTDPRSPASEAYRTLRTNLMLGEQPPKTLAVTSPSAEEGKSTAAANLAVTLAQSGRTTILVDCDLRRPSQHTLWGLSREPGLTTEGAQPQPTTLENLTVLTAGADVTNPADFIGQLDARILELTAAADMVLFDAPPVLAVTDAAVLATKLDGVLMVLRANSTRRTDAEEARHRLERVNAHIVGAVLLNAKSTGPAYYGE